MSTSNTLTKNDLKKVLEKISTGAGGAIDADDMTQAEIDNFLEDINAQGGPSEYKKLLWTNPSPASDFGAQTLTLDLSGYDEVEVYAGFINSSDTTNTCGYFRAKVGGTGLIQLVNLDTANTSNASTFINIVSRQFQVSTTGITFTSGQMTYAGGAYANWSGRAVPFQIYGIKYERVALPQLDASDYVIEQGTDGIWTYRKWESGIAECWGLKTETVQMTSNYGGAYYGQSSVNFPTSLFITEPILTATRQGRAGAGLVHISSYSVSTTVASYFVDNTNSSYADAPIGIAFHAMGRWK